MSAHLSYGTPAPPARPRRPAQWIRFLALATALVLLAAVSVGVYRRSTAPTKQDLLVQAGLVGKPSLVIGIRDDIPRIAERTGDGFTGFDIDIATAVAAYLGFPLNKIEFLPIEIEARGNMHAAKGKDFVRVDLVVASYSITEERIKQGVNFSAPYLETTQAVATRPDFTEVVESMSDLRGRKVCTLGTSTAEEPLLETGIVATARHKVSDCIEGLKAGEFDAVQSDAAMLAGFVVEAPDELRIHDITIDEPEMWAINPGPDEALHKLVDLALHHIATGDEWKRIFDEHLAPVQEAMEGAEHVAVATPPRVVRPEVREW